MGIGATIMADLLGEKEITVAQRKATLPLKSARAKQKIVVLNEQLRAIDPEIRSAKPVTKRLKELRGQEKSRKEILEKARQWKAKCREAANNAIIFTIRHRMM